MGKINQDKNTKSRQIEMYTILLDKLTEMSNTVEDKARVDANFCIENKKEGIKLGANALGAFYIDIECKNNQNIIVYHDAISNVFKYSSNSIERSLNINDLNLLKDLSGIALRYDLISDKDLPKPESCDSTSDDSVNSVLKDERSVIDNDKILSELLNRLNKLANDIEIKLKAGKAYELGDCVIGKSSRFHSFYAEINNHIIYKDHDKNAFQYKNNSTGVIRDINAQDIDVLKRLLVLADIGLKFEDSANKVNIPAEPKKSFVGELTTTEKTKNNCIIS